MQVALERLASDSDFLLCHASLLNIPPGMVMPTCTPLHFQSCSLLHRLALPPRVLILACIASITSFLLFLCLPLSKFMTFYLTSRGWTLSCLLSLPSHHLLPPLPPLPLLHPPPSWLLLCVALYSPISFLSFHIISSNSVASIIPSHSLSQDQLVCALTVGSGVYSHFLSQVGYLGTNRCKVCYWDILKPSRESFCFALKGKRKSLVEIVLQ